MKLSRSACWQRGILWISVFMALPLGIPSASADERHGLSLTCVVAGQDTRAGAPILLASWWRETLGNRTRIIQVTTLAVILGIFILQWRRT